MEYQGIIEFKLFSNVNRSIDHINSFYLKYSMPFDDKRPWRYLQKQYLCPLEMFELSDNLYEHS